METVRESAPQDLVGRKALVTGGAGGIGLASARRLAARGAHVVIADRDREQAERVAEELGGESWVIDLMETAPLEGLSLDVDILVNNAGTQALSPIEEFDPEVFRGLQRLMVEAPFLLIRAALPHMYRRGWGRIVNISSVHGLRASINKVAYVTAKHGIEGLSKVAAHEGGPHGVTSNCVNPGYVRTPLVEGQIAGHARLNGIPESEVVERIMLPHNAIKRFIEVEEVAALINWLASDTAAMVTGASYVIDGGWSAS